MLDKDILARLQKGESADAIAKEFTDALNKANEQYKKTVDAGKKKIAAKRIEDALDDYFSTFWPEALELDEPIELDKFVELLDSLAELFIELGKLDQVTFAKPKAKLGDPLSDFLRSHDL